MTRTRAALSLLLVALAGSARAQTMLDQQQRLIDIHDLLLDLPPVEAPGGLRAGQVSLGIEIIGIPPIDGSTGSKKQITASDRTPLFPRPRLAVGLPAPEGFRAFAGLAYIPPFRIREVSTHYGAAEAGIAYAPGALVAGLRAHAVYAWSESPVTDPNTRDTLRTFAVGADVSSGYRFMIGPGSVTPYGSVGVSQLGGRFRVTSDGVVLTSDDTALTLLAGLRLLLRERWEAVAELEVVPARLVHPSFRIAYVLAL
ncbi:MAG TPA: autotransporter outer membrane beta-barrel domain-containing protein [Anaeromyxobacteraceae bacterium]